MRFTLLFSLFCTLAINCRILRPPVEKDDTSDVSAARADTDASATDPRDNVPLGMNKKFLGPLASTEAPSDPERGASLLGTNSPVQTPGQMGGPTQTMNCDAAGTGDLASLKCTEVPSPSATDIRNKPAAVALGKALFWDVQVGSDGKTACATCHFHAGIDTRRYNTLNPGPDKKFDTGGVTGPGQLLKLTNITNDDRVGSAGVIAAIFKSIDANSSADQCQAEPSKIFGDKRLVTGRNTPTSIGIPFYRNLFWDGRANHIFNGNDPFGETGNAASPAKVCDNCAMASQAVGPPTNDVEMSCSGRFFNGPNSIASKMLSRQALKLQKVSTTDSVLKPYAKDGSDGLFCDGGPCKYSTLIDKAFVPAIAGSHAEANFSRIWGQAIQAYLATLIPDETPFDRFLSGEQDMLTGKQRRGLSLFRGKGDCTECHAGSELSDATHSYFKDEGAVGEDGEDTGFHNIGVRPSQEDLGRAGLGPKGVSFAENSGPNNRGAFKTPMLRNVGLTAPYFHNGGKATLEDVVDFYSRGGDFQNAEKDRHIKPLKLSDEEKGALVDFLRNALTDPRVVKHAAPFDHPSLPFPSGEVLKEAGAAGVDFSVQTNGNDF